MIVMQSNDLSAMNSISEPEHITPIENEIEIDPEGFTLELDPYSLTVIKITNK
jgi:alpha-L-arabinofuranosidase